MKKALIFGITGQDGAYLARYLLLKEYQVFGTSRDVQIASKKNLDALSITSKVTLLSMAPNDFRSVLHCITISSPDEIYNLAGQTSVGLSFEQPMEAFESIGIANLVMLEAIRFIKRPIRFYNAGSSEIFGNCSNGPANESSLLQPKSPYGVAKCTALLQTANYREAYGLYACTGILFNHESPLRPERFVTQKVIQAACRISAGSTEQLSLGDIEIERDWGWAPEYVEAMWKLLQCDRPTDLVIASGHKHSLREFVETTFAHVGLEWNRHVIFDERLVRPSELRVSYGDATRAQAEIGWRASIGMDEIVKRMISTNKL